MLVNTIVHEMTHYYVREIPRFLKSLLQHKGNTAKPIRPSSKRHRPDSDIPKTIITISRAILQTFGMMIAYPVVGTGGTHITTLTTRRRPQDENCEPYRRTLQPA